MSSENMIHTVNQFHQGETNRIYEMLRENILAEKQKVVQVEKERDDALQKRNVDDDQIEQMKALLQKREGSI